MEACRSSCALFFLLVSSHVRSAPGVAMVPLSYRSISRPFCSPPPDLDILTLAQKTLLPRVCTAFPVMAPSDMGKYPWFDCGGGVDANGTVLPQKACSLNFPSSFGAYVLQSKPSESPVAYFESLAMYAALGVVFAVLTILCGLLLGLGRYVAPCFRLPAIFQCGGAAPTAKKKRGRGFEPLGGMRFGYPKRTRRIVVAGTACCAVSLVALMCSSFFLGTGGLSSGVAVLTSSDGLGKGLATMIQSVSIPANDLVITLGDGTVNAVAMGLSAQLQQGMDVSELLTGMQCVNASLQRLPDTTLAAVLVARLTDGLLQVTASTSTLIREITSLAETRQSFRKQASTLNVSLVALGLSFANVTNVLSTSQALMVSINATRSQLLYPVLPLAPRGLLPSVLEDFAALTVYYPSPAQTLAVTGPNAPTTNASLLWALAQRVGIAPALGGADVVFDPKEVGILAASTGTLLRTTLLRLPDFSTTADALEALNRNVTALAAPGTGLLSLLSLALTKASNSLAAVPRVDSFSAPLFSLGNLTDSIDLTASIAAAANIATILAPGALPDFRQVLEEVNKIGVLSGIEPCLSVVAEQVGLLNSTLVRLPDAFSSITAVLGAFGGSSTANMGGSAMSFNVSELLALTSAAAAPLLAANETLQQVNASTFLSNLVWVNYTLMTRKIAVDFSGLAARSFSMGATLDVPLAPTIAQVDALRARLLAASVNASSIAALRSFQTSINALLSATAWGALEYAVLSKGYCANVAQPSVNWRLCAKDADCGAGGTCNDRGRRRCVNNWFPTAAQQKVGWWKTGAWAPTADPTGSSTGCAVDSDCSPLTDFRCVGAYDRAATLAVLLNVSSTASPPNVTAVKMSIESAIAAAQAADTDGALKKLVASSSAIAAIDTAALSRQIQQLFDSFDAFNFTQTNATLLSLRAKIAQVPLVLLNVTFPLLADAMQDMRTVQAPLVANASALIAVVKDIFVDQAGAINGTIGRQGLTKLVEGKGFAGGLGAIASFVDAVIGAFAGGQRLFPLTPTAFAASVKQSVNPLTDPLQSVSGYQDTSLNGPLYYVLMTLGPFLGVEPLRAADPTTLYIFAGKSGGAYAPSKSGAVRVCVTTQCLQTTGTYLLSSSLSGWKAAVPALAALDVPLTLANIQLLLWVIPIFLALLFAMAPFARLCCQPARWQKVPLACAAGFTFALVPFLLVIAGTLFAVLIFVLDVCASGTNIGYNYVLSRGDALCADLGGVGNAGACSFAFNVSAMSGTTLWMNATLSLPQLTENLLGSCPDAGGAKDTLYLALQAVALQLRAQTRPLATMLALSTESSGLKLQQPLQDLFVSSVGVGGDAVTDFISALANSTLSCKSINVAIGDVKDAVCCNVVTPLWWYASLWFLCLVCLVICGVPLALLGRKRIPDKPWGRDVINAVSKAEALDDMVHYSAGLDMRGGLQGGMRSTSNADAAYPLAAIGSDPGARGRTRTDAARIPTADAAGMSTVTPTKRIEVTPRKARRAPSTEGDPVVTFDDAALDTSRTNTRTNTDAGGGVTVRDVRPKIVKK